MASGVENEKVTDSPVTMNRHDSYSLTVTSTPRSTDRKIDAQTPERIESVSSNDRVHPVATPPDKFEVSKSTYF